MNIRTYATPASVMERNIKETAIVVVDLLRASTTIITALTHGVIKVIPAADANEAVTVARSMGKEIAMLSGESGGVKYQDFDTDNSPSQFMSDEYKGKTVVLATSNGTAAIQRVRNCDWVFIGGLSNKTALARKLIALNKDVSFVWAGTNGRISIDDFYCVGAIISVLRQCAALSLSDTSMVCEFLYEKDADRRFVSQCAHFKHLEALGLRDDLQLCFTEDTTDAIPKYVDGILIRDEQI